MAQNGIVQRENTRGNSRKPACERGRVHKPQLTRMKMNDVELGGGKKPTRAPDNRDSRDAGANEAVLGAELRREPMRL